MQHCFPVDLETYFPTKCETQIFICGGVRILGEEGEYILMQITAISC